MTDSRTLDEWAADVATATRAAQGLPRYVDDPVALDRLATVLTSATTSPSPDRRRVEGDAIGAAGPSPLATDVRRGSRASTAATRASSDASARRSSTQAATAGPSGKKSRRSPLKKEA